MECRFCGFGEFGACPNTPIAIVVLRLTVDGSIETFDAAPFEASLRRMCTARGLPDPAHVIIRASAASITVHASLVYAADDSSASEAMRKSTGCCMLDS